MYSHSLYRRIPFYSTSTSVPSLLSSTKALDSCAQQKSPFIKTVTVFVPTFRFRPVRTRPRFQRCSPRTTSRRRLPGDPVTILIQPSYWLSPNHLLKLPSTIPTTTRLVSRLSTSANCFYRVEQMISSTSSRDLRTATSHFAPRPAVATLWQAVRRIV